MNNIFKNLKVCLSLCSSCGQKKPYMLKIKTIGKYHKYICLECNNNILKKKQKQFSKVYAKANKCNLMLATLSLKLFILKQKLRWLKTSSLLKSKIDTLLYDHV